MKKRWMPEKKNILLVYLFIFHQNSLDFHHPGGHRVGRTTCQIGLPLGAWLMNLYISENKTIKSYWKRGSKSGHVRVPPSPPLISGCFEDIRETVHERCLTHLVAEHQNTSLNSLFGLLKQRGVNHIFKEKSYPMLALFRMSPYE